MWKPSALQIKLLRAIAKHPGGTWLPPHDGYEYVDGEMLYIHGSGMAAALRSLFAHELVETDPVLAHVPYACRITDAGRAVVDGAK